MVLCTNSGLYKYGIKYEISAFKQNDNFILGISYVLVQCFDLILVQILSQLRIASPTTFRYIIIVTYDVDLANVLVDIELVWIVMCLISYLLTGVINLFL